VVNLDMIGYNSDERPEPIIDLYAHSNITDSLRLTRIFSDIVGLYDLNLIPHRFDSTEGFPIQNSDQWSFLEQGFPAFLAIEDMDDSTPYYHRVTDRLSTLNLDYYADCTKAAIATIAHLGQLRPTGQLSGTVSALDTGQPLLATVGVVMSSHDYTFTVSTGADGTYSLFLPFGSYTLTAGAPAQPYYPATITDIVVLTNTLTVQNIRLQPHLRVYLPLILLDREMSGTWAF
jgi:Zn-dependent M28 family amino/carboxypeptidase